MYIGLGLPVKYPSLFEKQSNTSFIKVRPVGGELFHADGQTNMTKLTAAFRSFFRTYWHWSHVTLCNEAHRPPTNGKYRQISFYARDTFTKKSRKWNTGFPFKTMYWLVVRGSAKPSQSSNWGRRLARSASRRPPVC